ncbi:MAG: NlpC/P60 family protein [Deltaproteobacteria bacterium]|nr:NlpC/P60 family protein [Deltaproteobacteria bacterium]
MPRRLVQGCGLLLLLAVILAGCAPAPPRPAPPPAPAPPRPRALTPLEAALERALNEFDGAPYRRGGATPAGVDCSGLVQAVHQRLGLKIPRTTTLQYSEGQPVHPGDLRPGDVVFFNRLCQMKKSELYTASLLPPAYTAETCHNGIYIGAGRFVHASRRGVVINRLDEEIWRLSFMGARRFLPLQENPADKGGPGPR